MARLLSLVCALALACSPSQTDGPTADERTEQGAVETELPQESVAEAPAPEPSRPAFEPTGDCVEPPQPMAILEIAGREANPRPRDENPEPMRRRYEAHEGPDLDGDGTPERFVPEVDELACPHEVRYGVYVMRGDCGHRVGTVLGSMARETEASGAALDDLIIERQWTRLTDPERPPGATNVATLFRETARYRFDGERYVRGEAEVTSGICHHCALLRCRRIEP